MFDVSYINVSGTFYDLCRVLAGYSRSLVYWDLRESPKQKSKAFCNERIAYS
jgi:hypothetical protein